MKIAFQTLGCKLNYAETSAIANAFRNEGHEVVRRADAPDALVINSCAVTDVAEKKCRAAIRQAKRNNPDAIVAVVGCFSQLRPEELSMMEEVDLLVGNEHKYRLVALLNAFQKDQGLQVVNSNILKTKVFVPGYSMNDRTRTFLKIQDGCDHRCTYCTIPNARGRSRSASVAEILPLIQELDEKQVPEIVLTGVNVGDFGRKNGESLLMLLHGIANMNPKARIRLGSVEPELLSDEIIRCVARTPALMPHFHLPLQSGSDAILKKMHRKYDTNLFAERIRRILDHLPDACIACDVITGFPAETEDEFKRGVEFIQSLPLSYLHVFTYSERPGTLAADIEPKIHSSVKRERSKLLHEVSEQMNTSFARKFLGTVREVLFESELQDGLIRGFTDNYLRVAVPWNVALKNQCVSVLIEGVNDSGTIIGSVIGLD
jgi:threonylcarbamoyladenosine tRNA methylthiotransferase MtaB